jgi:hypothetical protein
LIFKQRQLARYDLDAVLLLPISAIGLTVLRRTILVEAAGRSRR